jgi:hypothetical protein
VAATVSLTEAHRLVQARLAARTVAQMRTIWPLLDVTAVDATFERWLRAAMPIVQANRHTSAALAAAYYDQLRAARADDPTVPYTPYLDTIADSRAVTTSLLVTGPYSLKRAARNGVLLPQASDNAMAGSAGAAARHVTEGGRGTIDKTTARDRAALGWARVGSGFPCGFCSMLISRGPVYKTRESAEFSADGQHYHDHCHCEPEPVFNRDDWDGRAQYEHYHALWTATKADRTSPDNGPSSSEVRRAFRRAVEAH